MCMLKAAVVMLSCRHTQRCMQEQPILQNRLAHTVDCPADWCNPSERLGLVTTYHCSVLPLFNLRRSLSRKRIPAGSQSCADVDHIFLPPLECPGRKSTHKVQTQMHCCLVCRPTMSIWRPVWLQPVPRSPSCRRSCPACRSCRRVCRQACRASSQQRRHLWHS
jgi:hypothetical protein